MNQFRLLFAFALFSTLWARAAPPLFYSYQTDGGGGIAVMHCEAPEGTEVQHRSLWEQSGMEAIKKVSLSENGRYVAANLEKVEDRNNVVVVDMRGNARFHSFKDEADHIAFHENLLYVGTTAGELHRLNPENGKITATWDFRKILDPSGRRPESFLFDEQSGVLWVSFQKDSKKRKHLGSRVVGIDLDDDKVIADLQLPRDKPELHYSASVDGRESGPNPEVLFVDADSNTLFVTLDLYGAVAMMDLDAALKGNLENYRVHATALDGSWGSAFPDRVGHFTHQGRTLLIVANASDPGGAAVVDPRERKVVQRLPVPGGLTTLHWIPRAGRLVSGVPGKVKSRGSDGLNKTFEALDTWYQFEPVDGPEPLRALEIPQGRPVHRVAPVDANDSPLVYLNLGKDADEWRVMHPAESEPRAELKAFGKVVRTSR
jgi:hypothetical protein